MSPNKFAGFILSYFCKKKNEPSKILNEPQFALVSPFEHQQFGTVSPDNFFWQKTLKSSGKINDIRVSPWSLHQRIFVKSFFSRNTCQYYLELESLTFSSRIPLTESRIKSITQPFFLNLFQRHHQPATYGNYHRSLRGPSSSSSSYSTHGQSPEPTGSRGVPRFL